MTELHNMSVPPRSALSVQRAELRGRRYRITITALIRRFTGLDEAAVAPCFRKDGAACALALLHTPERVTVKAFRAAVARYRRDAAARAALREACDAARRTLQLPQGFGFFVEEASGPDDLGLSGIEAIAILAGRSGPLYLPSRFEPSLIIPRDVTLFFPPCPPDDRIDSRAERTGALTDTGRRTRSPLRGVR